ncbi:uncharacterized protein EI90DRAFT_543018 [Cantharellus anzutake]|uniref:uncharacterized protein n=1 Tax=Cantharellus anzutake TaxID=1750568 RepID=UPI001903A23C|nr:uncharacterized protein EI90DRAFT_543018 [Cantharellus anzutake]KAF8313755.1 hypothetical protein EI90DRAFT_543018 [Cantharellus anzutake]
MNSSQSNVPDCYTCQRIRKKKCPGVSAAGACEECVKFDLECLRKQPKRPAWFKDQRKLSEARLHCKSWIAAVRQRPTNEILNLSSLLGDVSVQYGFGGAGPSEMMDATDLPAWDRIEARGSHGSGHIAYEESHSISPFDDDLYSPSSSIGSGIYSSGFDASSSPGAMSFSEAYASETGHTTFDPNAHLELIHRHRSDVVYSEPSSIPNATTSHFNVESYFEHINALGMPLNNVSPTSPSPTALYLKNPSLGNPHQSHDMASVPHEFKDSRFD